MKAIMKLTCLFIAALFLFAGCVSNQGFTGKDIENPCAIVNASEMASICGMANLETESLSKLYFSKDGRIELSLFIDFLCQLVQVSIAEAS